MAKTKKTLEDLRNENEDLRLRLREAEETLDAIRNGEIDAVVATSPDGNEQVYTLNGADRAYRLLFETMNEGAAMIGADGTVYFCNTTLAKMLRSPLENLIGSNLYSFAKEQDVPILRKLINDTLAEPQKREFQFKTGNHFTVPVLVSSVPVKLATSPFSLDGSVSVCMIISDLTERKKAEADLQQTFDELTRSNEDLEEFAYIASHDLQEPLRNISTCLQILEKDYKSKLDSDADQLIQYALDAVPRMKALMSDLLSYSRINRKGAPFVQTDCEKVLEKTLLNLGPSIEETKAKVTHDPLPKLSVDPTQMMQVFQNLISNAIKFRGDNAPRVHISSTNAGEDWVFSVKDNGIGIEPRYLEKIFALFQRLHTKTSYEGTGVGLAIVKKIIERHRGQIWAESEPGKGSTFCFTIPTLESNR